MSDKTQPLLEVHNLKTYFYTEDGVVKAVDGEAAYAAGYRDTQAIFAEDLPIVPLYWRLKVAAARAGMCNFSLDPTASAPIGLRQHLLGSDLWNIEAFDYGSACER